MSIRTLLSLFLCVGLASALQAQSKAPDLVLQGKVAGTQNKTYFEVPFEVPAGIHRISVDFSYTGKENKTTLDLGIADPERFRGNSGGNKSHFTIGESDATPSYLPGRHPCRASGSYSSPFRTSAPREEAHLPRRDPLQRSVSRTRASPSAAARNRHALVSRRSAHAHGSQRWQLRQPNRQARALPRLSHRAGGHRARSRLHRHVPITTPHRNTMRCASCSPISIDSCSSLGAR